MDVTESESWLTVGFLTSRVVYFRNDIVGGIPPVKTRKP